MKEFNFGPKMVDFGKDVLKELIMTDFGKGCAYDGISGHGTQSHHGGPHSQVNLFKEHVSGEGMTFRFFEKE